MTDFTLNERIEIACNNFKLLRKRAFNADNEDSELEQLIGEYALLLDFLLYVQSGALVH